MNWIYEYVLKQLTQNDLAIAGVLSTIFFYLIANIKSFFYFIKERFIRWVKFSVTVEQSDEFYTYLSEYLADKYPEKLRNITYETKRFNSGEINFNDDEYHDPIISPNDDKRESKDLIEKHHVDYFWFWKKRRLIFITKEREKLENASSFVQTFMGRIVISGLFAKKAIKELIDEVNKIRIKDINSRKKTGIITYQWDGYNWYEVPFPTFKKMKNLYIENKQDLIDDLDIYQSKITQYVTRGIIPKRGYFFDGDAGLGKTQTAFAMAHYTKRKLYVMNVAAMGNDEYIRAVKKIEPSSMLLLDDGDDGGTASSRKKKTKKVNTSSILSFLDGVLSISDLIVVLTTNHPEKFDKAFTRDGRFHFFKTFFIPSDKLVNEYLINEFDYKGRKVSGNQHSFATIENKCFSSEDIENTLRELELLN